MHSQEKYCLLILTAIALFFLFLAWVHSRQCSSPNSSNGFNGSISSNGSTSSTASDPRHDFRASLHEVLDHIAIDRHYFNLSEPRKEYSPVVKSLISQKRSLWKFPCGNVLVFHNVKIPIYYAYDPDSKTAYELRYLPRFADWEISQVAPIEPPPTYC